MGIFKKLNEGQEWFGINIKKDKADALKQFLRDNDIYFEPSENGNLVHFEISIDNGDIKDMITKYISESCVEHKFNEASSNINHVFSALKKKLEDEVKKKGFEDLDDAWCDLELVKSDDSYRIIFTNEFDYEDASDIADELNKVFSENDVDSYFDADEPGIWVAYIWR